MEQKVKVGDKEYSVNELGEAAKSSFKSLQFATNQIDELSKLTALLRRAKNSYLESLKSEIISKKAGFNIDDD